MITIRTNIGMIPGGFMYQDPRTPAMKWDDTHSFLEDRVREVITFRAANPSLYPEPEWTNSLYVRAQIETYNCERLGNDGRYCIEDAPPAPSAPSIVAPRISPCCSVEIVPVFCPTCSGRKITHYKCPNCDKTYPI